MQQKTRNSGSWVIFFFWPLLAFLRSVWKPYASNSKNVVWAFIVFFGFTFVIPNTGVDANRYRDNLDQMHGQRDLSWKEFTELLYAEGANFLDVFQPVITFLVSRFTDDFGILFAVFGAIFGFFYTRNIWMLLDYMGDRIPKRAVPYIIIFCLLVAFWQINGFRFWTATHIYLFGLLRYLLYEKRSGLFIAASSILMHFAFAYPVVIMLLYILLGNRLHIYFVFFLISTFFVELQIDDVLLNAPALPAVFQEKVNDYTNLQYIERIESAKSAYNWYVPARTTALKYLFYIYIITVYIFKRQSLLRSNLLPVFCFSLLLFSMASLTANIPSFTRYVIVSELFLMFSVIGIICGGLENWWLRKLQPLFYLVLLLYAVVEIRVGMDFIGVATVFSNPLVAALFSTDTPLIEFIK